MTAYTLETLKRRKDDILPYLESSGQSGLPFRLASTSKDRAKLFNRFLWKDYSGREMEVSTANAPHIVIRYRGPIVSTAILKCLHILLERHKALNSSIEISDGHLYLVHQTKRIPAFQENVVKGETIELKEKEAMRVAEDLVWKEYDLDNGPLYRVFLLKITSKDCILGVGMHHTIGDMVSMALFFQELITIYNSVVTNSPLKLSPVQFQYMDYLASMEDWSKTRTCKDHINYWKEMLKSAPVTDLLPDWQLSFEKSFGGRSAVKKIVLNSSVTRDLKNLAAGLRKTLFCVLLSLHKMTIWKMTGQEEQIIIALHAGRINADFQNIIGNISMEMPYRTSLSGNPDFIEITERVSHTMHASLFYQPVPLDWIRQELLNDSIPFRAPGMNFIPDSTEHDDEMLQHLRFDHPDMLHGRHGFPVSYSIEFREIRGTIEAAMIYRKDLYSELTVSTFLDHFRKNISKVINAPNKKLYDFKRDLNFAYY